MKSIGIALLWILGFAFLLLLCWVFVLIIDWPAWGAIPLFLGVIALYFLIKLLRRLWIVARSRARIAQSEVGSLVVDTQKSSINNVIHKWREGLHLLRSSTLRKYGNPL